MSSPKGVTLSCPNLYSDFFESCMAGSVGCCRYDAKCRPGLCGYSNRVLFHRRSPLRELAVAVRHRHSADAMPDGRYGQSSNRRAHDMSIDASIHLWRVGSPSPTGGRSARASASAGTQAATAMGRWVVGHSGWVNQRGEEKTPMGYRVEAGPPVKRVASGGVRAVQGAVGKRGAPTTERAGGKEAALRSPARVRPLETRGGGGEC